MGWRVVVVTNPSKLDYSMGYLAVRDVEKTTRVHLDEISVLIVGIRQAPLLRRCSAN